MFAMWSILFLDFSSCIIAHYARSPLCFQSQMSLTVGIATAILPNRPSDAEKGDIQETGQEWSLARHWRGI